MRLERETGDKLMDGKRKEEEGGGQDTAHGRNNNKSTNGQVVQSVVFCGVLLCDGIILMRMNM